MAGSGVGLFLLDFLGYMNRLAGEGSPYLRQHSGNPVEWFPWGEEAFGVARELDRPVLLSVGYSACHWCHVMAHESFEDPVTAGEMNELFVNVKVDREERPDVDAIYMEATTAMTGHGGWPMTVFLTPEGHPFFCGTYFPPEPRQGMPSFRQIMARVAEAWREQRNEFVEQAEKITEAVRRSLETQELGRGGSGGSDGRKSAGGILADDDFEIAGSSAGDGFASPAFMEDLIDGAVMSLRARYDPAWGGFGMAPKFPQTMNLELLLRVYWRTGDTDLLQMVENSFDCMSSGGIYDHLGGGFARYSVDRQWLVPHFEKMLYDNALLARLGLHLWQITGKARYLQVVEETIGYVLGDLRHSAGGFYSARDADSEGEEGKFYVWSLAEIREVLEKAGLGSAADEVISWYGATQQGNFEGANILWRPQRGDILRPPEVEKAREAMLRHREGRVPPGLDDKVITEWNALMLATLAEAAAATTNGEWLEAAIANAEFLCDNLRREGNSQQEGARWLRVWQESAGEARYLAYAADYADLCDAFTRLYEATGQKRWLEEAESCADDMLELFADAEIPGEAQAEEAANSNLRALFTTGSDAEKLVVRPKDTMDNALPSANSAACVALIRLHRLCHNPRYIQQAAAILQSSMHLLKQIPSAFGHLLGAADLMGSPSSEIVITGDRKDLVATAQARYLPHSVLSWGDPLDSPLWEGRASAAAAFVCQNSVCELPADSSEELAAKLGRLSLHELRPDRVD